MNFSREVLRPCSFSGLTGNKNKIKIQKKTLQLKCSLSKQQQNIRKQQEEKVVKKCKKQKSMFATANIRNQNALKNEKNQYFYSQRKSLFSCEFFEWFIYVCALLCLTALGIDFLFTEFSFCCCSSWDV